ncbi:hypothetical protein DPMN_111340 [Dreissena polymorpha]|uniref:Uncharacterized protein n=1 Tax=Dreissena polymorpha TaxID=45954 RepID=A0A9D4KDN0_DREPO|nr:hypothetical protein DPMN_111340 [Dreissena polymorpha]
MSFGSDTSSIAFYDAFSSKSWTISPDSDIACSTSYESFGSKSGAMSPDSETTIASSYDSFRSISGRISLYSDIASTASCDSFGSMCSLDPNVWDQEDVSSYKREDLSTEKNNVKRHFYRSQTSQRSSTQIDLGHRPFNARDQRLLIKRDQAQRPLIHREGHSIQNEYKQNRSLISESGKRAKAQIDSGHGLTYPRERRSLTQREQVKRPLIYKEEYSDPFPTYRKEQILHIPHPIERNYKPFDHREHLNIAHFPNAQEPPYFQNVHAQPTYFPRVQEKPTYVAKGHAPDPAFKREHVPDPYHQRKNVQHLSFQRKRLFNERKNVQRLSYPREHEKSPSHLIEKEKPPATQSTQVLIQSVRKGQVHIHLIITLPIHFF